MTLSEQRDILSDQNRNTKKQGLMLKNQTLLLQKQDVILHQQADTLVEVDSTMGKLESTVNKNFKDIKQIVTTVKVVLTEMPPGKTSTKPADSCTWLNTHHYNLNSGKYWLNKGGRSSFEYCKMDEGGVPPPQYRFSDTALSWSDAEKSCIHWGGHLVTVTSKQQNDYFHKEVERRYKAGAWIGFSDEDQEGLWKWVDPERSRGYTNWHPRGGGWQGEPNGQRNENCASITGFEESSGWDWEGYWNDNVCKANKYFICQR